MKTCGYIVAIVLSTVVIVLVAGGCLFEDESSERDDQ